MNTPTFEYLFEYAANLYHNEFGYTLSEYFKLIFYAKQKYEELQAENERLKQEIATMNTNIVASLERDIKYMQNQLKPIIKHRTIESLDV